MAGSHECRLPAPGHLRCRQRWMVLTMSDDIEVTTPAMSDLDYKINLLFPGVVVRKDLVKAVKGNAIVPTYVLEYLLGQFAATDDEATIQAGIDTVRRILAENYV